MNQKASGRAVCAMPAAFPLFLLLTVLSGSVQPANTGMKITQQNRRPEFRTAVILYNVWNYSASAGSSSGAMPVALPDSETS